MFVQWIFLISSATLISSKWIPERIVGGHLVSIESVPWQASLLKNDKYDCGAVIYSETVVLTAAHCVKDPSPSLYSVRVGSSSSIIGGQVVKALRVLKHDKYGQPFEGSNDIAVIQLQSSLQMGVGVSSIPLADSSPRLGSSVSVSGWGKTGLFKGGSELLLQTTVAIVNQKACQKSHFGRISKDMICAAALGKDSCFGDSGGPLVSSGKLVGLVSFGGFMCANPFRPGVYANVAELKPWILRTIQSL